MWKLAWETVFLTSETKGGTNFSSLSSSGECSKASQPRHHIQAPGLITCCIAFKRQCIKAKTAKFVSEVLCDCIHRDSWPFGEVTGSDVTERKGSNEITCLACNRKTFVWTSASLWIRDCSCQLMCVSVFSCACDIDHLSSTAALKVRDPPLLGRLALQISVCVPL